VRRPPRTSGVPNPIASEDLGPIQSATLCSLCRTPEVRFLFNAVDHQYKLPGVFALGRCARCGLVGLSPMPSPEQVNRFYAVEDHYSYLGAAPSLSRRLKNRLLVLGASVLFRPGNGRWRRLGRLLLRPLKGRLVPRSPFGGRLLDVGCGNGAYLAKQRDIGWEAYGCELSESGARTARQGGLDVFHGPLFDAKYPDAFFDVVHLEQVFEHVSEPGPLLREIRRILKPDGLLLIGVPNGEALSFRIFKRHWGLLGVPFHLFQYSPSTLTQVLARDGFRVERFCFGSFPICWIWSLNNLLNAMGRTRREIGFVNNGVIRRVLWAVFLPLGFLLHLLRPRWSEKMQAQAYPWRDAHLSAWEADSEEYLEGACAGVQHEKP